MDQNSQSVVGSITQLKNHLAYLNFDAVPEFLEQLTVGWM